MIPSRYQEIETIYQSILDKKSRCITLLSSCHGEGTSSITLSLANRLIVNHHAVLVVDLNQSDRKRVAYFEELEQSYEPWCFSDISCQLNVYQRAGISYLSIKQLKNAELAREKKIFSEAIIRLLQEFDYILFDMSPATLINQANFPLHVLSETNQHTFVVVSLGKCDEESLHHTVKALNHAGLNDYETIVTQQYYSPLGPQLAKFVTTKLSRFPSVCSRLSRFIKRQTWLYHNH